MAVENIKKQLRCYLTEAETVGYAKQAAVLVERVEDLDNEKKMTAKKYAAEISQLQDELFGLSRKVRNGFEMREVGCDIVRDFDAKMVVTVRSDTGEILESRAMKPAELQRPIFDGPGKVVEQFPDDSLEEMVDEVIAGVESDESEGGANETL